MPENASTEINAPYAPCISPLYASADFLMLCAEPPL
jgi:hypothetical protein